MELGLLFSCISFILLFQSNRCAGLKKKIILEGDILLTKHVAEVMQESPPQKNKKQNDNEHKRNAIKHDIYWWKDGRVPYVFSSDIDPSLRKLVYKAFAEYKKLTCIRFVEKSPQDIDHIEFIKDDSLCYSSIGRQGGRQTLSLGEGCETFDHVLHELMHSIGFFHEQSRYDRDLYVKILWWNVADGAFKNFASYGHGKIDTIDVPYDKQSILHYHNNAFSKNGEDTIESVENPIEKLGRNQLSRTDVYEINKLYGCYSGSCEDKYDVCMKFKTLRLTCYKRKRLLLKLCPKSCGFCRSSTNV